MLLRFRSVGFAYGLIVWIGLVANAQKSATIPYEADSVTKVALLAQWQHAMDQMKIEQSDLRLSKAIAWADSAIKIGTRLQETYYSFEATRQLGVLNAQQGKYADALSIFRTLLDNHKVIPTALLARVHYNIGNVFTALRRYDNALLSFNQAWQMLESDTGEHLNKSNILHNVAFMYLNMEQFDSCETAFQRFFHHDHTHNIREFPFNALRNYAYLLMRTGSLKQAKTYLDSIMQYKGPEFTPQLKGLTYKAYGELYNIMEKPALALLSLEAADKILRPSNNQPMMMDLALQRYRAYKLIGDYSLALEQFEQYEALQDTLNKQVEDELNASLLAGMQKIADTFEKQALEARSKLLKSQSESDKRVRGYLILVLVLAFVVLMLLAVQLQKGLKQKNELQAAVQSRTEVIREQLKQLELKNSDLEKATNELNSFLYSASHDLRAPIASLLGLVQVGRIALHKPEELEHYFTLQEQSLRRMDEVIHGLMDFAEHKNRTLQLADVDLPALIQGVLDDFSFHPMHAPMERKCTYHFEETFRTDRSRLLLVLRNLIQNAYKYANPNEEFPFVHIDGCIHGDGTLELSVADNGVGISEENQQRVFEMFYRASTKKQGSGLGLYICKETIEKLGGELTLVSALGQGTKVVIRLPVWRRN